MHSKGVSAVIATVLMLLITIALAGTAYLYITGVFTARTGVVLSVDGLSSNCNATAFNIVIKNEGTAVASVPTFVISNPSGGAVTLQGATAGCVPLGGGTGSISAGTSLQFQCATRTAGGAGTGTGTYSFRISSGSSVASATVYCSS